MEKSDINIENALKTLIKSYVQNQTDEERQEFLKWLLDYVCLHCGSLYLPCYCTRDE